MIIKSKGSKQGQIAATFQLPEAVSAETVHVVGDFNDWSRHSHALTRCADGRGWRATVELEQGRTYQFRYLINGKTWQNDWQADGYAPNPFGGENSVLET